MPCHDTDGDPYGRAVLPHMTLFMIGLGLFDEKNITLRGLEVARKCGTVYLEYYTSRLACPVEKLEKLIGKKIRIADRDLVEKEAEDTLLEEARDKDVALLVVGDPMAATTHRDLLLQAFNADVKVGVINNASVFTAVGNTGLDLYKFGRTASIVFPEKDWMPTAPYDIIRDNQKLGLHTLCLLDIKMSEPSREDLKREAPVGKEKRAAPLPPRFMTVNEGIKYLLDIEKRQKKKAVTPSTLVVGCARLCALDYVIKAGRAKDLLTADFGAPLHCLIVPGKLHFLEEEMLAIWR